MKLSVEKTIPLPRNAKLIYFLHANPYVVCLCASGFSVDHLRPEIQCTLATEDNDILIHMTE